MDTSNKNGVEDMYISHCVFKSKSQKHKWMGNEKNMPVLTRCIKRALYIPL